jgi:hypothetical protein
MNGTSNRDFPTNTLLDWHILPRQAANFQICCNRLDQDLANHTSFSQIPLGCDEGRLLWAALNHHSSWHSVASRGQCQSTAIDHFNARDYFDSLAQSKRKRASKNTGREKNLARKNRNGW